MVMCVQVNVQIHMKSVYKYEDWFVFPQSVVIFDYKWRENVVSVTGDVIDFRGTRASLIRTKA